MTKKERLEKQQQLAELRANGMTAEQIGIELCVPVGTIRRWILNLKPPKPLKVGVDFSKILSLKLDGMTNKELSNILGVSERTIVEYLVKIKDTGIPYIDFHTGEIISIKDIFPKDFQLFNYIKLSTEDKFNKTKFRNLFLEEDKFYKANYFNKKDTICIFSEEYIEYFEECLNVYCEKGSLYRIKDNDMISGVGFYGTDKWKDFDFNISSFLYDYNASIKEDKKEEFLSRYFEIAKEDKKNGRMFYFYGCGIELYQYIKEKFEKFNFDSIPIIRKNIKNFPNKIYYIKKNFEKLDEGFRNKVLKQVEDGEAICSKASLWF